MEHINELKECVEELINVTSVNNPAMEDLKHILYLTNEIIYNGGK